MALTTSLAMVLFTTATTAPAHAHEPTPTPPVTAEECSEYADATDKEVAASPSEAAKVRAQVRRLIAQDALEMHSSISQRDIAKATVLRLDDGTLAARVSLGESLSNLTLQFDQQHQLLQYSEAHLSPVSSTSGQATIYRNGVVVLDRVVDATELQMEPAEGQVGTMSHNMGFWKALNRCLSSAGISAWILAAASLACGAGGPAAVIVCLVGVGVGAGTASYCVRWAIRHG